MGEPAARLDHLSSADIAAALGCSKRHAIDLMGDMVTIDISKPGSARPTLRVAREDFEAWLENRRVGGAKTGSGRGAAFGGLGLGAREYLRGVKTAKRRESRGQGSSERPPIRLTQPRAVRKSAT